MFFEKRDELELLKVCNTLAIDSYGIVVES